MSAPNFKFPVSKALAPLQNPKKSLWVPLAALAVSLIITVMVWLYAENSSREHFKQELQSQSRRLTQILKDHVEDSIDLLHDVEGLYAASKSVERDEWASFLDNQFSSSFFPGLLTLRFSQKVSDEELDLFSKSIMEDKSVTPEGYPDFKVHPKATGEHFIIKYVYPIAGFNDLMGYDLAANPERREAVESARDSGEAIATGMLTSISKLAQAAEKKRVLIYVPVYKNGTARGSVEARRAAFYGALDAAIDVEALTLKALEAANISNSLNFSIYDSYTGASGEGAPYLLFDHGAAAQKRSASRNPFAFATTLDVANRTWTIEFNSDYTVASVGALYFYFPVIILCAGIIFSMLIFGMLFSFNFSRYRAIEIAKKITDELAKSEAQLRQSQKLETIGTLAGGIAHDLNNSLVPVVGYLDLLLDEIKPGDSTYVSVQKAHQAAKRCAEAVMRLVEFSRPSSQIKTHLNLSTFLEEAGHMLRTVLPSSIDIEIHCAHDLWPVMGNATELESMIMNFATNARDAIGAVSGKFKITAENAENNFVLLRVKDNGCGISPENLDRIYEPFFSTKPRGRGTGLGLTMVFNIVKDHGGKIEVSSTLGKETEFKIYLPASLEPAPQKNGPAPVSDVLPRGKETVLFVDDEESIRTMGKTFLQRLGYKVVLAVDGEEALKEFQNRPEINIMVLDITMPKMTGGEVLRRVLQLKPDAKIIVSSGYTAEGSSADFMREGASEYLKKPYSIMHFAKTIRQVLDGEVRHV